MPKRSKNSDHECLITGTNYNLHKHHIFGAFNRNKSGEYGFVVYLSAYFHDMSDEAVHFDKEFDLVLKRWAQGRFEQSHTREEFIKEFGRSYILNDSLDYEEELKKFIDHKRAKLGIYI